MSESYLLNSPTLGIHTREGLQTTVTIPKGAMITVADLLVEGTELVDCLWDGAEVMLFSVDIRERGTRIQPAKTKAKST